MKNNKEIETSVLIVGGIASLGLIVALVAWAITWSWVWYAYLAFFCGLVFIIPALIFTAVLINYMGETQ